MAETLVIKTERINPYDSSYFYLNIEHGGARIGKARINKIYGKIIIKNINIFPEYQKQGFGTQVISYFKNTAREIIADRVRGTAKSFWEKMGFEDMHNGNYRWVSGHK